MKLIKGYNMLTNEEKISLLNLWHLSKVITQKRHARLVYTAKQFIKEYNQYSLSWAYKFLTREV